MKKSIIYGLIFSALIFVFCSFHSKGQYREAESFLWGFENTGVYIDTTGISDILEHVGNFEGRVYGTKGFFSRIDEKIFDIEETKKDSFDINAIKQEFSEKKALFQLVEQKYGKFHFDQKSDLIVDKDNNYHVSFSNLQNVDSVSIGFLKITGHHLSFKYYPIFPLGSVFEQNNKIQIYPNPAGDVLNITYPYKVSSIQLTTIKGETLKTFSRTEIAKMNSNGNVSVKTVDFSPGVYFLIIDNNYFEKFIIEP